MPLATMPKCFLDKLCITHEMSVEQWIDMSAELDLDGLEFYWGFTPWQEPAKLEAYRQRVADQGRRIAMMCYGPDFTQPDPQARQREIDMQKRAIEATSRLGASYCRVLSGQRRPEGPLETGIAWAAECITELLPFAAEHDVTLILENHYKDGTWHRPEYAQDRERFLAILRELPSPWLRVQYDPSNAIVAGIDPYELLDEVLDRVATVHASDRYLAGGTLDDLRRLDAHPTEGYAPMLKHGVIGEGLNDYDKIFATLARGGFGGWVSIEDGEGDTVEAGMENLRRSVTFLREKMTRWLGAPSHSHRTSGPHV